MLSKKVYGLLRIKRAYMLHIQWSYSEHEQLALGKGKYSKTLKQDPRLCHSCFASLSFHFASFCDIPTRNFNCHFRQRFWSMGSPWTWTGHGNSGCYGWITHKWRIYIGNPSMAERQVITRYHFLQQRWL